MPFSHLCYLEYQVKILSKHNLLSSGMRKKAMYVGTIVIF
jgi:hypothetical protein